MNYWIRFQDTQGVTTRSEFLAFDQDSDASAYARAELPNNPLIEVWKGEALVGRLDRDAPAVRA